MKSLLHKSMLQFTICTVAILLLSTPLFYYLTEHYYAEELIETIHKSQEGKYYHPYWRKWRKEAKTNDINSTNYRNYNQVDTASWNKENGGSHQSMFSHIDAEMKEDIITGVMIQFFLVSIIFGISITLTIRFIARRLWLPFDETLNKIEKFTLGKDELPQFPSTDIKEFYRLNGSITALLQRDISRYKIQKEFTENASHELQTPIAIFKSKLDLLMQEDLNEKATQIVQDLYTTTTRISHLNHGLLLLAKIENNQYKEKEQIQVDNLIKDNLPQYGLLYTEHINFICEGKENKAVAANRSLIEILVNNLVINALRHNIPEEPIKIVWSYPTLLICNKAANGSLNTENLFRRFNNPSKSSKGNGLGLAIVKGICDYYNWQIEYTFIDEEHHFSVKFC